MGVAIVLIRIEHLTRNIILRVHTREGSRITLCLDLAYMYVKPITCTFCVVGRSKKSLIIIYMQTSSEVFCQSNGASLTSKFLFKVFAYYRPQKQPSVISKREHTNEVKELLREKSSSVPSTQGNPNRLSRDIASEAVAFKRQKSTGGIKESGTIPTFTSATESSLSSDSGKIPRTSSSTEHGRFSGFAALIKEDSRNNEEDKASTGFYQRPSMPKLRKTKAYSTSNTVQPSVTKASSI